MKTIYKYPLSITETQTISLPESHKVLEINVQNGKPYLWVLVDTKTNAKLQKIQMYGTGEPVAEDIGLYLGTAHLNGGALVVHVFMDCND